MKTKKHTKPYFLKNKLYKREGVNIYLSLFSVFLFVIGVHIFLASIETNSINYEKSLLSANFVTDSIVNIGSKALDSVSFSGGTNIGIGGLNIGVGVNGGGPVFAGSPGGLQSPTPLNNVSNATSVKNLILSWANFALTYIVILAVLSIIYGGVLMMTSAANPENVEKGKKIILWTIVALIIIMSSYAIVNTVINFL